MITRSIWISIQVIDTATIKNAIQIGFIVLLLYGLVITQESEITFYIPVILYAFMVLLSLSTSRVTNLAYQKGSQLPPFSGKWLLMLLIISTGILLVGLLGGWILGTQISHFIIIILFIFIGILLFIAMIFAAPFIFIINYLITIFSQSITNETTPLEQEIQVLENPLTKAVLDNVENLDQLLNKPGSGKIIIFAAFFLILLYLIFQFIHKKPWTTANLSGMEETSKLESEKRIKREFKFPGSNNIFKNIQKWMITNQIRRMYFSFLDKCYQLDLPRDKAETPIEFQQRAESKFPNYADEIATITNLYTKIRYGLIPESEKEIQAAKTAWTRFKSIRNS